MAALSTWPSVAPYRPAPWEETQQALTAASLMLDGVGALLSAASVL